MNFILERGSRRTFVLIVYVNSARYDLSGCRLKYMVKRRIEDPDTEAKITKISDISTEINITNAIQGEAEIYIRAEDTKDLEIATYFWGIALETVDKQYYMNIASGTLQIIQPLIHTF